MLGSLPSKDRTRRLIDGPSLKRVVNLANKLVWFSAISYTTTNYILISTTIKSRSKDHRSFFLDQADHLKLSLA